MNPNPTTSPQPTAPALMTVADLARYLQRSRRAIFSDLSAGKIPCVRLPNGHPRFLLEDIRHWLESGCPSAEIFRARKSSR